MSHDDEEGWACDAWSPDKCWSIHQNSTVLSTDSPGLVFLLTSSGCPGEWSSIPKQAEGRRRGRMEEVGGVGAYIVLCWIQGHDEEVECIPQDVEMVDGTPHYVWEAVGTPHDALQADHTAMVLSSRQACRGKVPSQPQLGAHLC